jgi:L-asparaginase II
MTAHPEMVAGPERFDTRLMQIAPEKVVAKGGAQGYQGLGIRCAAGAESSVGLGVAIKIADGDPKGRARPQVCCHLLEALGVLGQDSLERLRSTYPCEIRNNRDVEVGCARVFMHLPPGVSERP